MVKFCLFTVICKLKSHPWIPSALALAGCVTQEKDCSSFRPEMGKQSIRRFTRLLWPLRNNTSACCRVWKIQWYGCSLCLLFRTGHQRTICFFNGILSFDSQIVSNLTIALIRFCLILIFRAVYTTGVPLSSQNNRETSSPWFLCLQSYQ